MPFRFITNSIRTYLIDYPVVIALMVAPFPLKLGKSSPVALWFSMVTRVMALLLPTLTEHLTGLIRVISYWQQLWVDRALGVISTTATSTFHATGLDARHYWVLAVAVLLTTSALNTLEVSGANRATSTCGLPFETPFDSANGKEQTHNPRCSIVDFATRATQLRHAGIDRYFGKLLSVDQVRRYKPAPAIIISLLQSGLKSAGRSEAD